MNGLQQAQPSPPARVNTVWFLNLKRLRNLSVNHTTFGRQRGLMDAFGHGWMRVHR